MHAASVRQGVLSPPVEGPAVPNVHPSPPCAALPPAVEAAVWRGSDLGSPLTHVLPTGWPALDEALPGQGWPGHQLTEILQAQPSVAEWRLVGPVLRSVVAAKQQVAVVGPPKTPHLPGLRHVGLEADHLVWIQAETPSERLWVVEQLLKSAACGAVLAWLPQARPEQLRRLQVLAQGHEGPVFLFRPQGAQHEASPAPLRLLLSYGLDWVLQVHVLKRRGPQHEGWIELPSVPGGLASILTPRLRRPSRLMAGRPTKESADDVLGSPETRSAVPARVATGAV